MYIISGKYKGKKIKGYDIVTTRPTMQRVKESLFGMIQNYIPDSKCLDLFAGSGNLGLEALSNGASSCTFIDNNINAIKVLKENLKDIGDVNIVKDDYNHFLKSTDDKFDIIFLDPPYKDNLINSAIDLIIKKDLLNDNGLIICEYVDEVLIDKLDIFKEKKYGDKYIKIYKKTS